MPKVIACAPTRCRVLHVRLRNEDSSAPGPSPGAADKDDESAAGVDLEELLSSSPPPWLSCAPAEAEGAASRMFFTCEVCVHVDVSPAGIQLICAATPGGGQTQDMQAQQQQQQQEQVQPEKRQLPQVGQQQREERCLGQLQLPRC